MPDLLRAAAVLATLGNATELSALDLPQRAGSVPQTTDRVPHVQIGVEPVPEITEAMLAAVGAMADVEIRDTVISLPGALGFWIDDEVVLARPDVIVGGREFAHVHPDGSLHASLPPELAVEAVARGWAVAHPWADQRPGWDGFVMIYTPLTVEELDVVVALVQASRDFVVGD